MSIRRLGALAALMLVADVAVADVRLEGPVEYGVFKSAKQDFQPGERILAQKGQEIEVTDQVPARLGSKFGLRYRLEGKVAEDTPLTLMYFTPGVITPDGKRHDKFEVVQKLVPGAALDVMAYEFTEQHEVVRGQWRFMVFQGDHLLAEKSFTVR